MESEDSCLLSPSDPNTTLDWTKRSAAARGSTSRCPRPAPAPPPLPLCPRCPPARGRGACGARCADLAAPRTAAPVTTVLTNRSSVAPTRRRKLASFRDTTVNAIFGHRICSRPSGMLLGCSRWIVEVSSIRGKNELFTIALTAVSRQGSENGSDSSDPKMFICQGDGRSFKHRYKFRYTRHIRTCNKFKVICHK